MFCKYDRSERAKFTRLHYDPTKSFDRTVLVSARKSHCFFLYGVSERSIKFTLQISKSFQVFVGVIDVTDFMYMVGKERIS